MNSDSHQTTLALQGIRVLDFTWIHAGPSATRILSDQGAEVIKVESNNALSVIGGPASATARGLGQRHNWNAGKLSISLNMKTPQAIDIAKRLVAVSDVVAENFSGRVMPSWGLDYDSIMAVNPGIIMLSMSGFGRTGPWKDRVSYGQTLQAWAGFTQLTGFPDTDPSGPASAYSDAVGGMAGAQAVLLALIHRAKTGRGQWLDVSQFESLSSLLETLVLDMSANGPAAASVAQAIAYPTAAARPTARTAVWERTDGWLSPSSPTKNGAPSWTPSAAPHGPRTNASLPAMTVAATPTRWIPSWISGPSSTLPKT